MCSEPVMRAPASGLRRAVALAQRHQAGHLVLGELDLLAAEVGQREVGDLEVVEAAVATCGSWWWSWMGLLSVGSGSAGVTAARGRGLVTMESARITG